MDTPDTGDFLTHLSQLTPLEFAVIVLVLTFVAAKVLRWLFEDWLKRMAKGTKTKLDDIIVAEVGAAINWLVYLAGIYLIITHLGFDGLFTTLLLAVAVLIAGKAVINIIIGGFREYIHLLPLEEGQKYLLLGMEGYIRAALYIIVVLVMLASAGIDVWPIITSLGIGGLAISMALKDVLTDYVSGLIIILGRSLRRGQRILVKDKGVEGEVVEVGWRYTTLKTPEGEVITIPNRVVSSSVVIFKEEKE